MECNRVQYKNLRSLADVRMERRRVQYELQHKEDRIRADYGKLTEIFSLSYWVGNIARHTGISSTGNWAYMGYNLIASMIQKNRKRKAEKYETEGKPRKKKKYRHHEELIHEQYVCTSPGHAEMNAFPAADEGFSL